MSVKCHAVVDKSLFLWGLCINTVSISSIGFLYLFR